MTFFTLLGLVYFVFILDIYLDKKLQHFVQKFIDKRPKLSFVLFVIIALVLYQSLLDARGNNSNSRYEDRRTDCEYDAYHGWNCQ